MADSTQQITPVSDLNDLPGGIIPEEGVTQHEAAEGLFDLLGSEDEFSEQPEDEGDGADLEAEAEEFESDELEDLADEDDEEYEADDDLEEEEEIAAESDDGENDEETEEALYEVTLPGGEKAEVTLDELRAGYSRTEDYTRKRQRDAAEHAEMLAATRERRDAYVEGLNKLATVLRDLGPQKPSQELRQSNPGEYAAQMAEWQDYETSLQMVGQAKAGVEEEISTEVTEAAQNYVNEQWAQVVQQVPEWADDAVAVPALAALKQHAVEAYGFSEDEVNGLADARLLMMLKTNFDNAQTTTEVKETVEKKRKTSKRLSAGKAKSPRSRRKGRKKAQRNADQLAASTGSVTDAARAIELALTEEDL